jgi:hypothetical protein
MRDYQEDPKPELSYKQINLWSDWVEKTAAGGESFDQLWSRFRADHPTTDIKPDVLYADLMELRNRSEAIARSNGISVDDIGYINTGYSFPKVVFNGKDYGRMNKHLVTEIRPKQTEGQMPKTEKRIPDSVQDSDLVFQDGYITWPDPSTGDIVYGDKELMYYSPRVRKLLEDRLNANKNKSVSGVNKNDENKTI